MPHTFARGHKIIWDYEKKDWFYEDTGELFDDSRPCVRCGRMPTSEGHDACLGHLEGVKDACCGHGVSKKYIMYGDKSDEI